MDVVVDVLNCDRQQEPRIARPMRSDAGKSETQGHPCEIAA